MKISFDNFKKNSVMETELASLKTEHSALLDQVKAFDALKAEHATAKTASEQAKATWETEKATLQTEHEKVLTSVKAEYEAKLAGLNTNLETTKASVQKEVVATLSSVGIQAGEVKAEMPAQAPMDYDTAMKQWQSLKGEAAKAFYNINKTILLRGNVAAGK